MAQPNYNDPRWNHCLKKKPHPSREAAEKTLAERQARLALTFPGAVIYQCRFNLKHWHIGHTRLSRKWLPERVEQ